MREAARRSQVVICGLGGQGVLFVARVLGEAALLEGREVLVAETHGMAQRGGAVDAHVKIGGFSSALVARGRADVALALHACRLDAAQAYAGDGGLCLLNGPGTGGREASFDAAAAAEAAGHPRSANLMFLGFAVAQAPDAFPNPDAIAGALSELGRESERIGNRDLFLRCCRRHETV